MSTLIDKLLRRTDTWRGRSHNNRCNGLTTGHTGLDQHLVGRGWPLGNTIEILSDSGGLGAMNLFLPAMINLSEQQRWQAFIAPPCIPYSPLLAAQGINTDQVLLVHPKSSQDTLWATEQALRSNTCSAVFSWLPENVAYSDLRRLQLAATHCDVLAVLFRSRAAAAQHAPASLRLEMREYRSVHILKQRGGVQHLDLTLSAERDLPAQPRLWELPSYPAPSHSHVDQIGA